MEYELELKILDKIICLEEDLELLLTKIYCQSLSNTLVLSHHNAISSQDYLKLLYEEWQNMNSKKIKLIYQLNLFPPSVLVQITNYLALNPQYHKKLNFLNTILKPNLKKERRKK